MRGVSVDVLDRSWPEIPWDDENQLTQRWPNAHIWIIPNVYVGTDGILFNKDRVFIAPYDLWLTTIDVLEDWIENDMNIDRNNETVTFSEAEFPSCFRWRPSLQLPLYTSPRGHPRFNWQSDPDAGADQAPFVVELDRAVSLVSPESSGYFHFLVEVQSRLVLVLDQLRADPTLKILIDNAGFGGSYKNSWTTPFLEQLCISPERLVTYDPRKVYHVRELIFPHPFVIPYIPPSVLTAVRRLWVPMYPPPAERNLIVVVRRGVAPPRRQEDLPQEERDVRVLSNHDALLAALRTAVSSAVRIQPRLAPASAATINATGSDSSSPLMEAPIRYEVFDFASGLTPKQCVDIFSRSALIIGPVGEHSHLPDECTKHGAGLANCLFAAPGTFVIEIMPIPHKDNKIATRPCFWYLSSALGQCHELFASQFDDGGAGWSSWDVPSFSCDVGALVELVLARLGLAVPKPHLTE